MSKIEDHHIVVTKLKIADKKSEHISMPYCIIFWQFFTHLYTFQVVILFFQCSWLE